MTEQPEPQTQLQPHQSILSPQYRGLTIGLLVVIFGAAFESLSVATIMPKLNRDLGGIHLYGWAFSAFMLANLVGITVAGGEADRHGPAKPFLAGISLFIIGLALGGLAPSMELFVVARGVQGFGAGSIYAMAYVCIGRTYPNELRPKMLASLSSAWVIPGLVGPAIAAFIAQHLGWRWVMLGIVPIPIFAAFLAQSAMRKLDKQPEAPLDKSRIVSALKLSVGTGIALAGITGIDKFKSPLLIAFGLCLLAPALLAIMPAGTFRIRKGLPAAIVTTGLLNLAFFGTDAFLPLALTSIRGRTLTQAGMVLTFATLSWAFGSFLQSRLSPTKNRRVMVQTGALIMTCGISLITVLLMTDWPVLLAYPFWAMVGLGMGVAYSTTGLTVIENSPKGGEGSASSAMQVNNALGIALGTGIGGAIIGLAGSNVVGRQHAIGIVYAITIATALLTVFVASRLPARPPIKPDSMSPGHTLLD